MADIRVRFPPSPTGYLHVGGARTALYNWLFCRKMGGTLVLRIEDTDPERSTEASAKEIVDGLTWMGIDWDEGPYSQMEYAAEHRATAETLIERGVAYRCFCSKEQLEQKREAARAAKTDFGYDGTCRDLSAEQQAQFASEGRPSVVRFRVPDSGPDGDKLVFEDLVFGRSEFALKDIEDFIIVRSTGEPLYVLSNVVDDHRDRISHVIRGNEHLMNTPKQVLLYRALQWDVPQFAHLALILDPKKAKISKRRHGEVVAVQFYQQAGFLPAGFCNFIALLGWSPGDDREIFLSLEELKDNFSFERLVRANSVFNYRKDDPKFISDPKALHINAEHLRAMPVEALAPLVETQLKRDGIWNERWADGAAGRSWFLQTLTLIRVRYHLLPDFSSLGRAFFSDDFPMAPKAQKSLAKDPKLKDYLPQLADRFAALGNFTLESSEAALRALAEELEVKAGLLINASRAAVSGQAVGPGLFDLLGAIGQESCVKRLRQVADTLQ